MKSIVNSKTGDGNTDNTRQGNQGAVEGPASGGDLNDNAEENVGDRDSSAIAHDLDPAVSQANEVGKKAPEAGKS